MKNITSKKSKDLYLRVEKSFMSQNVMDFFCQPRKHYSPGKDLSRHKTPQQHCWEKCGSPGRGRGKSPDVPPVPPRPSQTTTSPHHLKHRHREQEQARAMAQVVRWLEQEFSSPRDKYRHKPDTQRTEHHHVHEHVHHHYHHYQDTPVLVWVLYQLCRRCSMVKF